MKRTFAALLTLACLALALPARAEPSADEILRKCDDQANRMKDLKYTMVIMTKAAGGPEKKYEVIAYQKGPKRLYQFTDTGMVFLSLDADTSYVYLPEDKKVRRVAAHSRNQTFLGTDYNSDDLAVTRYGDNYAPKLVEATAGEWALDLTPKPGKDPAYSHIRVWIDKEKNVINKLVYFNKKGEEDKTEVRSQYKNVNGQWSPLFIEITGAKTGHRTTISTPNPQYNIGLSDDLFTQRQLKRLEQ
jgi:outer membrane lipoprotein-sorting protein